MRRRHIASVCFAASTAVLISLQPVVAFGGAWCYLFLRKSKLPKQDRHFRASNRRVEQQDHEMAS